MPNTVVNLSFQKAYIELTIKMPLFDFQTAFGGNINNNVDIQNELQAYFQKHIKAIGADKKEWQQHFVSYNTEDGIDKNIGKYEELTIKTRLEPPKNGNLREFDLYYDAIIHQVVTHEALIYVTEDWENGIHDQPIQAGIVKMDIQTGKIDPLSINVEKGSFWKGFKNMVELGMNHIASGTDHLLFLLTLLLPAPLLVSNKKWGKFGSLRYSLFKLLKIITAFTIGHSVTLLLGTLGFMPFSSRVIEIAIAISILVSAVHALKPLFYNKEIYIAAGFGLIHGWAFSSTLSPLHLDTMQMGLSILGFNLGIEIMQLGIMLLILPAFIFLSQTKIYPQFRILGAIDAGIAALAWVAERVTGTPNFITLGIESLLPYGLWLTAFFIIIAFLIYFLRGKNILKNQL